MNSTAKLEASILAAALSLGILGDVLLRSWIWGLNFALWAGSLGAVLFVLGWARPQTFGNGGWWLLLPIGLSCVAFACRDSLALAALDLMSLWVAFSLVILRAQGGRLTDSSLMKYAEGSCVAAFNAAFGIFPLLFGNTAWKNSFAAGWSRKGTAALLGVAFSFVPLLIFGSLLAAADAVFRGILGRIWKFDFSHVLVAGFIAMGVGGYLRGVLFGDRLGRRAENRPGQVALGAIEIGVMLGLLDLLFLIFVAVQVRYFFGGSATVRETAGLSYSEYARSGFFQLVMVAALVLPFLLVVHWLLRTDDAIAQRTFRWVGGIQIALLFVIMASAFQRMRLYQAEYGLSEQRLYPTAFMGWLAVVFIWFCWTVLRQHRERFAFGAMVAGFVMVAILQWINPDALIARTNLQRARDGRRFDSAYVANLGADAVPDLVGGMQVLRPYDRCLLSNSLRGRWKPSEPREWRSWTWARSSALQAVSDNEVLLRGACPNAK